MPIGRRTIGVRKWCAILWSRNRRARILELVEDGSGATTATIAQALKVSRETVRRDLLALEAEGLINRVHGGAISPNSNQHGVAEAPFERRRRLHWREKLAVGVAAAKLVNPDSIVFVDAGTTTLAFAEALADKADLTVVTNSIGIAERLRQGAILLGGEIKSDVPATFGDLTLSQLERFMADVAFISPVAVHATAGAMNHALHEAEVASAMIRRSKRTIVLADHSKIGRLSRVSVCGVDQIDVLVTDRAVELPVGEVVQAY